MLEEIKKEVSTIKLLSKYRRPLWDERGLARLLGGEDSKATVKLRKDNQQR